MNQWRESFLMFILHELTLALSIDTNIEGNPDAHAHKITTLTRPFSLLCRLDREGKQKGMSPYSQTLAYFPFKPRVFVRDILKTNPLYWSFLLFQDHYLFGQG